MKYGKIKDGKVVEYSTKPSSQRASDLTKFPELLKESDWLPVEEITPSLKRHEKKGRKSVDILKTKIKVSYAVKSTPLKDYKRAAKKALLANAYSLLASRMDPIEQMPSVYKALPAARRAAMDAEAASVFAEVKAKRALIKAAKTHTAVDKVYTGIVAFIDAELIDDKGFPIPQELDI